MRIIWGIIAMMIGTAVVMKTEWLLYNLGRIGFFEAKLSTMGGSRLGYKLVGIILIIIGIMMITNLVEGFGMWVASFFIPTKQPNIVN